MMEKRCVNCGATWKGCPNCKAEDPEQEMEYSPQNYLMTKLAKPATRMSLNDNKIEDTNSKYSR